MYIMEPLIDESLRMTDGNAENDSEKEAGESNVLLSSLDFYHTGKISYEQVVLIGIYSMLLKRSEEEIRQYMGIISSHA